MGSVCLQDGHELDFNYVSISLPDAVDGVATTKEVVMKRHMKRWGYEMLTKVLNDTKNEIGASN